MKKILALALALLMVSVCSFAMADRLDDILAAGKLTVATSPDWPPYEYIDDEGEIVGTDILMAQWMAEQLGVELEIQPMAFDACLAAVGQGDVDMMIAGLTFDSERLARMELTGIYWNEGDQGLLVKKGMGATYNSAEAFNGKTVQRTERVGQAVHRCLRARAAKGQRAEKLRPAAAERLAQRGQPLFHGRLAADDGKGAAQRAAQRGEVREHAAADAKARQRHHVSQIHVKSFPADA